MAGGNIFERLAVIDLCGDPPKPKVVLALPESKKFEDALSQQITQFCFPDAQDFPKAKMKSETFSFVLTDLSGNRQFGYCRRILQRKEGGGGGGKKGKEEGWPRAFVILSLNPCYSIFQQVLQEVEVRNAAHQLKPITYFIDAVLEHSFPDPGQSIVVDVISWIKPGQIDQFNLQRPTGLDSLLDFVDFVTLLKLFEPRMIIQLFSSLLVERRIIFVSSHLADLTAVINAMMALLYPFTWQHIFVPVLPPSLLTFCCAPMPFVLGILRTSLEEAAKQPLDTVTFVDVDNKMIVRRLGANAPREEALQPDNDSIVIPPNQVDLLLKGLEGNQGKKTLTKNEKSSLTNPFLLYIVHLISSYPNYLRGLDFLKEEFVADLPAEDQPLGRLLIHTQMFQSFIEKRAQEYSLLSPPPSVEDFAKIHIHDPFDQMVLFSLLSQTKSSGTASHTINLPKIKSKMGNSDIIFGDWMTKLGGKESSANLNKGKKKWNKRWFVLKPDCVEYYKQQGQGKPAGVIELKKVKAVALSPSSFVLSSLGLPSSVVVLELKLSYRTFFIHSDDSTVTINWYQKLLPIIARNNGENRQETLDQLLITPSPSSPPSSPRPISPRPLSPRPLSPRPLSPRPSSSSSRSSYSLSPRPLSSRPISPSSLPALPCPKRPLAPRLSSHTPTSHPSLSSTIPSRRSLISSYSSTSLHRADSPPSTATSTATSTSPSPSPSPPRPSSSPRPPLFSHSSTSSLPPATLPSPSRPLPTPSTSSPTPSTIPSPSPRPLPSPSPSYRPLPSPSPRPLPSPIHRSVRTPSPNSPPSLRSPLPLSRAPSPIPGSSSSHSVVTPIRSSSPPPLPLRSRSPLPLPLRSRSPLPPIPPRKGGRK